MFLSLRFFKFWVSQDSYLGLVHSDQALVDFGPGGNGADVPQLVGVLGERTRLHLQGRDRGTKMRRAGTSETGLG